MPSLGNDDDSGSEAPETCCHHEECEHCRSLLICRHWYSLVFVTTQPLLDAASLVGDCVQRLYPGKAMGRCSAQRYVNRTKSGFYVCKVVFKIPDGVELQSQDCASLEHSCTPEGQVKPVVLPQSCCREKAMIVERCFLDFLFKDGFGPGLEYDGSRSPGDELKELAESVLRVIGSICYDE